MMQTITSDVFELTFKQLNITLHEEIMHVSTAASSWCHAAVFPDNVFFFFPQYSWVWETWGRGYLRDGAAVLCQDCQQSSLDYVVLVCWWGPGL